MNKTILLEALAAISVASLNYDEWIRVGMALKEEGFDCSVWDAWSTNDSRYHAGECQRKWNSFRGDLTPVTGGTILHMANSMGWRPSSEDSAMDWADTLEQEPGKGAGSRTGISINRRWTPNEELCIYIQTLFKSEDLVSYVTTDTWQAQDGKWKPGRGCEKTAAQLLEELKDHPDDVSAAVGRCKPEAGAWIRMNPVDGSGISNENVTRFHYALVECDDISIEEQYEAYKKLELPIACLVYSGKKSLHAIVKVDAAGPDEYKKRVCFLYEYLKQNKVPVDIQNKNPSRLSRMPGIDRDGTHQRLVATNIGRRSWTDWINFVNGIDDGLPGLSSLSEFQNDLPQLPEELIGGILRCGHKMLIAGSSKAGKSFLLMELCIAIAEGRPWLGFPCKKGRVLYINLEIDSASCIRRFMEIYKALGIEAEHMTDIAIWNLRGHAAPLSDLVPLLLKRLDHQHFDAIIIDPIYKVITGDENNASDMARFCNEFDSICARTGSAVIYCHHHSKGVQGSKRAMDRASGSGVFARDPDAQLDMIQLELTDALKAKAPDARATAWRMESSLREFQNFKPLDFWYVYPCHILDASGELQGAAAEGSARANLAKSPKQTTPQRRRVLLDNAYNACSATPPVKVTDMAEHARVDGKTIRRYLKEFNTDYWLENGIVGRIEKAG